MDISSTPTCKDQTGSAAGDVVANISNLGLSSDGERGVLGIAFDPQYSTNKEVYLYYTATLPAIHNRVSRFTVVDTNAADYYFAGADSGGSDAGASGAPTESIIFDLDNTLQQLIRTGADHDACVRLAGIYHNLLRQWVDT